MKYILFFLLLTARMNTFAQEELAVAADLRPPRAVLDRFSAEFNGVTPRWSREGNNYRACFADPNSLRDACMVYEPGGKVLRRETEIPFGSYPAAISELFIKKYPGEKFKTWSSMDDEGKNKYYIRRTASTLWFDGEGKFIDERKP